VANGKGGKIDNRSIFNMGVIDTNKKITLKIPFYSVVRDRWGWIRECARTTKGSCKKCLFTEKCFLNDEVK
jgi:hypothetical protein